jgi:hypothetical protein
MSLLASAALLITPPNFAPSGSAAVLLLELDGGKYVGIAYPQKRRK